MEPRIVAAIDVGGTKIAGGVVVYEEEGKEPAISVRAELPTNAQRGGKAVLADIVSIAQELCAKASAKPLGVSVAAAGCIDPEDGSVLYANGLMPEWTSQPLSAALQEACGIPATALGDVHGHALGEARWGAARGLSSCLLVAVGTGLGGAYVVDGKVMRGAHGAAGHIGHTLHHRAAEFLCNCGAEAHVEGITSGTGIGALYQGVAVTDDAYNPALDGAEVSRRAQAGDPHAIEVLHASGFALGQACGSWANMFDPAAIILTGTVCKAGQQWSAAVGEGFISQALEPLRDTPILSAQLGSDAPLVGAAEYLLDSLKQ